MKVAFVRREQLTRGIWHHYFKPERTLRFEPGQYVELHLPGVRGDPRGSGRTLTLTSMPGEPLISFVTKDQPIISPYKAALASLGPGDTASITDPMGDLILPMSPAVPLVFVAGGIGISSFISMLRLLLQTGEQRPVRLHYALRFRQELIFGDELGRFKFMSKHISIAPTRLQASEIAAQTPPDSLFYISGSQNLVESLTINLQMCGIARQAIVFDYYDGYVEL